MTAKKATQVLTAALALCLYAPVSHAMDLKLFLMGGGSTLVDKHSFTQKSIDYGTAYRPGGKVTLGMEVPVTKLVGIEGAYAYGRDNMVLTNYADDPEDKTGFGIRNHRVSGNVVLHSPTLFFGFRPYATAGVEWDRFLPTSNATAIAKSFGFASATTAKLKYDNKLGFNAGFGLELKVTSKISLRLDARDHVTQSPTYGLPSAATETSSAYFPISGMANNLEYSLAIVYRWRR